MSLSTPTDQDAARLRDEALAWFTRRNSPDWSADHEGAFTAWLTSDARHTGIYARCVDRWAQFDGMPDDLLARMRGQLERDKGHQAQLEASDQGATLAAAQKPLVAVPSRRRFLQPLLAGAGAMAVLGMGGYVAWQIVDARPVLMQSVRTEAGQQKDIDLPDGTRVRLDTATALEISYFRNRREVRLVGGQAVFAVQPDTGRPFHVLAGPLRVTVVGTRFSVRHTPGQPGREDVQVAVEEGKVRVARASDTSAAGDAGDVTFLTAGQQIVGDRLGVLGPVSAVSPGGIAPWREQRVVFVDTPLGEALAELERYASTGLVVRDPAVASLRLTGTFDPMNRTTLRLALPRILPVRLKESGSRTEVQLLAPAAVSQAQTRGKAISNHE